MAAAPLASLDSPPDAAMAAWPETTKGSAAAAPPSRPRWSRRGVDPGQAGAAPMPLWSMAMTDERLLPSAVDLGSDGGGGGNTYACADRARACSVRGEKGRQPKTKISGRPKNT